MAVTLPSSRRALAQLIDHTLLAATADASRIDALCDEAGAHGLFSVCVHPCWVPRAAAALAGGGVRVCTVVGFPLGANASAIKAAETQRAIADGADEIDMVLNLGWLAGGDDDAVEADIAAVVGAAEGRIVKVIVEIAHLDEAAIRRACGCAVRAGASFVKTSTGFGPGGATVEAVALMREVVGESIGVKASGGIRDASAARAMIAAGASRIGASASLKILAGWGEG